LKTILYFIYDGFADFALQIWDWFNLYEYDAEKEEYKKQFTPT